MKQILCLIFFMLFATSCNKDYQVFIKEKAVPAMAKGIATGLECAKPDIIEADINKALKFVKIETANPVIGEACSAAVKMLVPILIEKGIPKSWECKGTMATKGLIAIGDAACSAAASAL